MKGWELRLGSMSKVVEHTPIFVSLSHSLSLSLSLWLSFVHLQCGGGWGVTWKHSVENKSSLKVEQYKGMGITTRQHESKWLSILPYFSLSLSLHLHIPSQTLSYLSPACIPGGDHDNRLYASAGDQACWFSCRWDHASKQNTHVNTSQK